MMDKEDDLAGCNGKGQQRQEGQRGGDWSSQRQEMIQA